MRFGGRGARAARRVLLGIVVIVLAAARPAMAETTVEHIKVHSPSVEGNLEGNDADRDVIVVLPSGYAEHPERRYPVLYFLHGFFATAQRYDGFIGFQAAMDGEAAQGHEMILVVPDSYTKHAGSMYSNSATVGDFEGFIARDLVAYVDGHYRTIAKREARGLAGHSMGGYGTFKIGMKFPEVFSSLYAMSSCCLSARTVTPERGRQLEAMSMEQALAGDFATRADFAAAAAWSPAPDKPPFYLDLGTKDGAVQPAVIAEWAANAPLALVPQYARALRAMTAIAMDVGDKDFLLADNQAMDRELGRFGVAHDFTLYEGDHGNRVAARFRQFVLPFFAAHLATE